MDAISIISSSYTGMKIAKELLSAAMEAKIDSATKEKIGQVLEKVGNLQDSLFHVQEELLRLQIENYNLSEKLKEKEDWGKNYHGIKWSDWKAGQCCMFPRKSRYIISAQRA
jgi:predicted nuclease with TOPRIM domain